jgi:hypothetical protein
MAVRKKKVPHLVQSSAKKVEDRTMAANKKFSYAAQLDGFIDVGNRVVEILKLVCVMWRRGAARRSDYG